MVHLGFAPVWSAEINLQTWHLKLGRTGVVCARVFSKSRCLTSCFVQKDKWVVEVKLWCWGISMYIEQKVCLPPAILQNHSASTKHMATSVVSFYQETSILIVAGVEPPSCVEWNLTLIYFVGCQCVIPIWSFVMKAFFWPTLETSCFVRKAWPRAFACCSNFTHTHITHIFEGRVYLMDAPWYSFFFPKLFVFSSHRAVCIILAIPTPSRWILLELY